MSDQQTAQQQVREQYKVAESAVQNSLRAWNEVTAATTALTLEVWEQSLRNSQEALANYRRISEHGLRTWQGYVQNVQEIVSRTN